MKLIQGIVFLSAALLTACATSPSVPFEGSTTTNSKLRSDAFNMVSMLTDVKGCSEIDKVETSIVKEPTGEPDRQESSEKWIVHRCQNTYEFNLVFTEDGAGGSFFNVSM